MTHKHILIATGIYPPSIGGPATYSKMLFDELPERGFDVKVISFDEVRKWPKILRHVIYFFKLNAIAKDFDVIYAQDPVSVGLPTLLASHFSGKPFLLRLGGDYAWEQAIQRYGVTDLLDKFASKQNYPFGVKVLKLIQKKVTNKAYAVIVPSEYLKSIVMKWGIVAEKIIVISNALEGTLPLENKEILRGALNINKKTIISAGRLVPWKGFIPLVEGLAEFLKKNNYSFLVIGSGPDKEKIEESIKANGLEEHVQLFSALSRNDLLRYIKASDVFVLNTLYEGFSHQILEAMLVGTPVISTRVGGNPEIMEDGVHGFLLEPNDITAFEEKIKLLFQDNEISLSLISHGKERASVYTKERALQGLIAILP